MWWFCRSLVFLQAGPLHLQAPEETGEELCGPDWGVPLTLQRSGRPAGAARPPHSFSRIPLTALRRPALAEDSHAEFRTCMPSQRGS